MTIHPDNLLVAELVLERFLEKQQPATVKEIVEFAKAKGLRLNEARVRVGLEKSWNLLSMIDTQVPRYSKSYPGCLVGYANAKAWAPSRKWLAELLIAARKQTNKEA